MRKIVKILAGCLILLTFLPTAELNFFNEKLTSFSAMRAMIGYSYNHSKVIPGNFWLIFLLIIPIVIICAASTSGNAAEYTTMIFAATDFVAWIIYSNYLSRFFVSAGFLYYIVMLICIAILALMVYIHFTSEGFADTNDSTRTRSNTLIKWNCLKCGSVNKGDGDYCAECGTKRLVGIGTGTTVLGHSETRTGLAEGVNAWRCIFCNNLIPNNIGFCKCGHSRGDSKKSIENEKKLETVNENKIAVVEEKKIESVEQKKVEAVEKTKASEELSFEDIHAKLTSFKMLLDQGLINQEDYDKKKSELLNI